MIIFSTFPLIDQYVLIFNLERMDNTSQWMSTTWRLWSHQISLCSQSPILWKLLTPSILTPSIIDLVCSAQLLCQQPLSFSWPSSVKGHDTPLPDSPQGISTLLPAHAVSAGKIWPVSRRHRYNLTLVVTFSSEDNHLTLFKFFAFLWSGWNATFQAPYLPKRKPEVSDSMF